MGPFRPFYIYSRFPYVGFANIPDLIFFEFLGIGGETRSGVHLSPYFLQLNTAQFFVYLLYIDLSPCLEGHLDPELIQVVNYKNHRKACRKERNKKDEIIIIISILFLHIMAPHQCHEN
jgi:hypothetical protein